MIKPGKLHRVKAENPSIYLTLEEMDHYAWQGLTPSRTDGSIPKGTVVLAVKESRARTFDNDICEIVHKGKVFIMFSDDLECLFP